MAAFCPPKCSALPLLSLVLLFLVLASQAPCLAQLTPNYYDESCPNLRMIVRATISANLIRDPTAPAALLRLLFHDCQVQGCDASILLDSQGGIISELESPANLGIRRLEFIDAIKANVENVCPGTVSCADIIALAARDAVNIAGGPLIDVPLGRRDGTTASSDRASAELPSADVSFEGFLQVFASKGMTLEESVAILGAHTLGVGHCASVANRLYPVRDRSLGLLMYSVLRLRCPPRFSQLPVIQNDMTSLVFDTQYFAAAAAGRGLFTVDSEVARDPRTAPIVQRYSANPRDFFEAFSSAFIKLSLTAPLTGSQGQIRQNCHFVN